MERRRIRRERGGAEILVQQCQRFRPKWRHFSDQFGDGSSTQSQQQKGATLTRNRHQGKEEEIKTT